MEPVAVDKLQAFFELIGAHCPTPATLYLLGGSALCLLGSQRATLDVDYWVETSAGGAERLRAIVTAAADEMHLDVEEVPPAEFVPIPPGAVDRRILVGQYGHLSVWVFDPYCIALSKIARGFEADMDDVAFLVEAGIVDPDELSRLFAAVLPQAHGADIVPAEFVQHFEQLRQRLAGR